jgi:hypothetical protein
MRPAWAMCCRGNRLDVSREERSRDDASGIAGQGDERVRRVVHGEDGHTEQDSVAGHVGDEGVAESEKGPAVGGSGAGREQAQQDVAFE